MAMQPKKAQPQEEEAPSFSSLMDMPMSQIKPQKPVPPGVYRLMIVGNAEWKTAQTGTQYTVYTLQFLGAHRDVDMDALEDALTLGDGSVQAITDRTLLARFYHTPAALPRLKRFLNNLGIEDEDERGREKPIKEAIMEVPGRQVLAQITHTTTDEGVVYNNLGTTAKVE